VFDESVFTDDEPSQYDLDVHAILDVAGAGIVVTLNHLGMVRAFAAEDVAEPGPPLHIEPLWTCLFAPDVERSVVVGDRIVGSRPREQGAPGLLVSERLGRTNERGRLDTHVQLETCGMVTALGAFRAGGTEYVAVGGNGRITLAPATDDGVGAPRWTVDVDFDPRVVAYDGTRVWVAGSERATTAVDDYDWNALHRGGFVALDPTDGRAIVRGTFLHDLAWGNGGVAFVLVPGALCGIGRRGEMYVFDARDAALLTTTAPIADVPLGIAHAAAVGDRVLYGFNRGGYRLHATTVAPIPPGRA
jgi:hypothetical protein